MPLLSLLASNPEAVRQMNIEQIVKTAGDGRLRDRTESQHELREFLRQAKLEHLAEYADACLAYPFDKSGQVLQDVVNELGRRLEYNVTNGSYQGTTNRIGFDGQWGDKGGYTLVVEVKTTDAYRISLDTIAKYREALLQSGVISNPSSVLIVVGRRDTGELEAQVRGSRHAWDIRLISVESLINLVRVKESTDSAATMEKIRKLLTPLEYTRLDSLVEIVFATAQDVESSIASETGTIAGKDDSGDDTEEAASGFTPTEVIEEVREQIISRLSISRGVQYIKKARALYWDPTQKHRAACTISKRYESKGSMKYWYAYHPQWRDFLMEGDTGVFVLGCADGKFAYAIPVQVLKSHLGDFHVTQRKDGDHYYHMKIFENENGDPSLQLPRIGGVLGLAEYRISL